MDERIDIFQGGPDAEVHVPYRYTIEIEVLNKEQSRLDYQEFFPPEYSSVAEGFVRDHLDPMLKILTSRGVTVLDGTGTITGDPRGPGVRLHLEGPTASVFDMILAEILMRSNFGRLSIADLLARATATLVFAPENFVSGE